MLWWQEDSNKGWRQFVGSMGLVRVVQDRLATAGKEEQDKTMYLDKEMGRYTRHKGTVLAVLSLIQSGALNQLVKPQDLISNVQFKPEDLHPSSLIL
ncbi:hypothetical protein HID58_094169 [Brassica napus]|uniref:Uncharacterized protein n=1 Tax=Brassica napus TaxID=3708 RepID=A0ABQ7X8A0_BRANA|nr:hypothetical protein HID58_094168 [Brassica napus]KAH0852200.1 hypothetical protein HID58_094169 [Brassica napus]